MSVLTTFDSRSNYLKRGIGLQGSTTLTLPALNSSVTHTVDHDLGYIPSDFEVHITDSSGVLWAGEKVEAKTDTSLGGTSAYTVEPPFTCWVTTTQLIMRFDNYTSPTATGTREVHWLIYIDYGA